MAKTITTKIKCDRPVSQSQLLTALKNSMDPIFAHLEEKLLEGDGKVLDIEIAVSGNKIKLSYGIGPIRRPACAACDRGDFMLGHHDDCPNGK